ncbi:MAG: hypothetical protein KCHDKBKB_02714 [Elusimicrobia bacterium]|nr:hypothetical protein [Elusimicrobiota bacterium]
MSEIDGHIERSKVIRIICGILWFIPIYLVVQIIAGAIIGGIAGADTKSFETGYVAGHSASTNFFQKYGVFFLLGELALTLCLSVAGILPGTSKWKKS